MHLLCFRFSVIPAWYHQVVYSNKNLKALSKQLNRRTEKLL